MTGRMPGLVGRLRRALAVIREGSGSTSGAPGACPAPDGARALVERYCDELPSNQTAADVLQGTWLSAFPEEWGVRAGTVQHFDFAVDPRVKWTNEVLSGALKGMRVLELGPFEAYNTWQLEKLGAEEIVAIEGNCQNFLKCLIVKEIAGLKARFLHGGFLPYLERCDRRFDIVWASGVLYHQVEPIKLLGLIAQVTDRVFISTHYYADSAIRENPDALKHFDPLRNKTEHYGGFQAQLFCRSYEYEKGGPMFAGGAGACSYWMRQEDVFACLRHFGFDHIDRGVEGTNHGWPAMFFLARRTSNKRGLTP